ncbi:PLDc N-terminal domain-containing protein [Microbacterium elymi]|uniref:PLDc N-terminal domain-containing protein n=1 Tax=Microbacterium elymi TaxID=2909587 RepID=A0ABY5NI71_9MICO|nr:MULTISPECIES: PLDc N-terminal domain-containing protein [Microbacterium]UUT34824.1 PLDc N-terminal domain-containing protein [Microbacterium elymi]
MARLLLILVLAAVIFWVFAVVDAAVQPPARHRGVSKPVWVVIVIVFPVVGGILWFTVGRVSARASRVIAPDDDPEFLRGLGPSSAGPHAARHSAAEQAERIRQLEQDLARSDPDDEDPPASPRGR